MISEMLFNENSASHKVFMLCLCGLAVIYVISIIILIIIKDRAFRKQKNEFKGVITLGLSEDAIVCLDDVFNVFYGITQYSSDNISNAKLIIHWLREILTSEISDKSKDKDTKQRIIDKLNSYIKKLNDINPYADLPDTERSIISDIKQYNELKDIESSSRKIDELINVIITRYEQQKKIEKMNKFSVPIAVFGVILTILFGIISVL